MTSTIPIKDATKKGQNLAAAARAAEILNPPAPTMARLYWLLTRNSAAMMPPR
jgi:hypothetical protein